MIYSLIMEVIDFLHFFYMTIDLKGFAAYDFKLRNYEATHYINGWMN